MRVTLFWTVLFAVGLSACGPDYLYRSQCDVDEVAGWAYQDSLTYEFSIADTLQIYNLHIELRHSKVYPFQNLYTQVHTTFPDGQRLTETLSLELADKAGIWLGDCGSESCTIDIPIQEGAYFDQPGEYRVTIEQFTRQDSLPDIHWLIFAVEQTEARRS